MINITRWAPKGFDKQTILSLIEDYGFNNDTLTEEPNELNTEKWIFTLVISTAKEYESEVQNEKTNI